MNNKKIGIVGGVGPFAGLDLFKKIFNLTRASADQMHLDVLLHSLPSQISDRTAFLTGMEDTNPAEGLFKVIRTLEASSADIIGIPCNTSHADEIWLQLYAEVCERFPGLILVNMIAEVGVRLSADLAPGSKVGIMATTGTVHCDVYGKNIQLQGMVPVYPDMDVQKEYIQVAIYNEEYGIKAYSDPVTSEARESLERGLDNLVGKGVDAIILGCTEIPLCITEDVYKDIALYDSTLILAHKLIELAAPDKLKY